MRLSVELQHKLLPEPGFLVEARYRQLRSSVFEVCRRAIAKVDDLIEDDQVEDARVWFVGSRPTLKFLMPHLNAREAFWIMKRRAALASLLRTENSSGFLAELEAVDALTEAADKEAEDLLKGVFE